LGSDDTPKTSRHIRDLGKNKTPSTRRRYAIIAKSFESQELAIAQHEARIAGLEEEVTRLTRGKKKRAIPNPNRRFMTVAEALGRGEAIPEVGGKGIPIMVDSDSEEVGSEVESEVKIIESPQKITRSGRLVKKPKYRL
jgi:hypothetical protein